MREIERLHGRLFTSPRLPVLAAASVLVLAASALLSTAVLRLWFASLLVGIFGKAAGLQFNLRRSLLFANVIAVLSLPVARFSVAATSLLFAATLYFCSERRRVSLLTPAIYAIADPAIETLAISSLSLPLFAVYLRILDFSVGRINIRRFLESFILHWLSGDAKPLEDFFEHIAKPRRGRVTCIKVGDARLVTTDFHPGPFRNVGGAKLVEALSTGTAAYLHSPTSHEWNPVSEAEVEKIRAAIACDGVKLRPGRPFSLSGERFDVFCLPFDAMRLIFVSGRRAIDDFSIRSSNVVVDCHNAHEAGYEPGVADVEEIESLVRAAEAADFEEVSAVQSAFVKLEADTESICGYVAALLLDYGSRKYAIVVFDSNNVRRDFRDFVAASFAKLGYEAIIASTDNHAKTGVRAKTSYKPAGDCEEDWRIVEKLVDLCRNAEFKPANFTFSQKIVEVKVFGDVIEQAREASRYSGRLIATFLALNAIVFLLSISAGVIRWT